MVPRAVAAAQGVQWIVEGWRLFAKSPLIWIVLVVVTFLATVIVGMVPVVGGLLLTLLYPVIAAGFVVGCRALDQGEELEIAHLFAGFTTRPTELLAVGALYLLGSLLALLVVSLVIGGSALATLAAGWLTGRPDVAVGTAFVAALAVLLAFGLLIPVLMAVWFAPPLIVLRGARALDAVRASFRACLMNILPLLVYAVIVFLLAIVASIPLALGWLALGPVLAATLYTAFLDIFPDPRAPAQAGSSFA